MPPNGASRSEPDASPLQERTLVWAGVYLLAALIFLTAVFYLGGPGLAVGDYADIYSRHRELLNQSLWVDGVFPLWNPYNFSGHPFMGDLLTAPFYPSMAIYLLLPSELALFVDMSLHLLLGALGARAWSRSMGLSWLGAGLAGLLYLSCPTWVGHTWAGHTQHVQALAWVPWVLWCAEAWLAGRGRRAWLVGMVAVAALPGSGGFPVAWMSLLFLPLYIGVRWLTLRGVERPGVTTPPLWRPMVGMGVQSVLGLCLAAPHLVPNYFYTRACGRLEMAEQLVASDALTLSGLLSAAWPDLLSGAVQADYQAFEWYGYPGLLMLVAALLAPAMARSPRGWLGLVIMAALGVIMAVGPTLGATSMLVALVPGYGHLRCHCRELYITLLFLLPLAGEGLALLWDRMQRAETERRLRWILMGFAGVLALGALPRLVMGTATESGAPLAPWLGLAFAGMLVITAWRPRPWQLAVLVLLHGVDVSSAGRGLVHHADLDMWTFVSQPGVDEVLLEDSDWYRFWGSEEVVNPNHGVVLQRRSILGYENQFPSRYAHYIGTVAGLPDTKAITHISPGLIDLLEDPFPFELLGLRYGLKTDCGDRRPGPPPPGQALGGAPAGAPPGPPPPGQDFHGQPHPGQPPEGKMDPDAHRAQPCDRWTLVENPDPFPRAVIVTDLQRVDDQDDLLARVMDEGFEPRSSALVEHPVDWPKSSGAPADATRVLSVEDRGPNRIVVELEAAEQALLVLSEMHMPGWSARIEEQDLPVIRADYLLRAVPVPPGRHTVELSYWPPGLGKGILLAILALLAALGPQLWTMIRRRRI